MKVHEYQAKALLSAYGVPVERGVAIRSCEEIEAALDRLGPMPRYIVKAQVHVGGRGLGRFRDGFEGGGVQLASGREEVIRLASRMLGNRLITKQSGPEGAPVTAVWVAEVVDPLLAQFYVSVLLDRKAQRPVILTSREGGGEIEDLAEKNPEKIFREYVHPTFGLEEFQIRKLAFRLGLKDDAQREDFSATLKGMWRILWEKDASLVEINPLALTAVGRLMAIDGKINFEDNGLFRHEDVVALRDIAQEDPKEVRSSQFGLTYVALDGTAACLTNGAGMAMATMDMLNSYGVRPANFLDLGDNSPVEAIREAFRILLSDPHIECLLVNIFGGAMRGTMVAEGIFGALDGQKLTKPLVVRMEGAEAEEGRHMLRAAIPQARFAENLRSLGEMAREAIKH
ncbi:MAG: ADP-forming succinate--CoA ligase subunit beta [Puniceicoccales bacterium]|jgi:succinyl-CoA synthetase beta subunit|nr:ADP-forming succinate--CoA ligase subunit beta [Puniceicoccales bacterium]